MTQPNDHSPSRRDFVGAALVSSTLAATSSEAAVAVPPAKPPLPLVPDLTRDSAALRPDKIVRSACQFCNSLCALDVHLKAGRVIDVRGVADDPVQAGGLCVKGPMMAQ